MRFIVALPELPEQSAYLDIESYDDLTAIYPALDWPSEELTILIISQSFFPDEAAVDDFLDGLALFELHHFCLCLVSAPGQPTLHSSNDRWQPSYQTPSDILDTFRFLRGIERKSKHRPKGSAP